MTNAIDDLFGTAVPATTDTTPVENSTNSTPNPNGTDSTANTTPTTEENKDKDSSELYVNVAASYKASDFPAGDNPPGTMTIPEFAGHLTVHNVTKLGQGTEGFVDTQKLYQAVKGRRWALPVVLVFPVAEDGTVGTDQREAKVYIPVDAAIAAWTERPAPGQTATSGSVRPKEDLLVSAYKNRTELGKAQDRAKKLAERIKLLQGRDEKYTKWLTDRGLTWDEANEVGAAKVAEEDAAKANPATPATA